MLLKVEHLSKSYGPKTALDKLSFSVNYGSIYGLLGPNGSGKTTALGIALGVIKRYGGSYAWFGSKEHYLARKKIGALLEAPSFFPWLTAYKNLEICAATKHIGPKEASTQIKDLFMRLDLKEASNKKVMYFSLGMKQRLGIAAVLLGKPDVLVLDEPTNGLDAQGIALVRSIIEDYAKSGKTIILASHILDEVQKVCTDVLIINNGKKITSGTINEILIKGNQVDIITEDLSRVEQLISESNLIEASCSRYNEVITVNLKEGITPGELNRFLFEHDICVSSLIPRKSSLEEEFLKLTGGGS
jgi:ABC-2 type transport system ATP-binding protein